MYRKKKSLQVVPPAQETTAYTLSENEFVEGDLSVGVDGMKISPLLQSPMPVTPASVTSLGSRESPRRDATMGDSYVIARESGAGELRLADLQPLGELGRGNGGVVERALHVPSGRLFALKTIQLDVVDSVRKQILLELRTLYQSQGSRFVKFFGAFFKEGAISVVMEYMDGGSLADISRKGGAMPEALLANVAHQVLLGLNYMHKERHMIHRDLKLSNLLVTTDGTVKIADFGVSGQLANTISSCKSWVGTVTYMSPERIQGKSYSVYSDIWSFGLCLLELALAQYPYQSDSNQSAGFWELLDVIVEQPAPELPASFSVDARDFVHRCLQKEPTQRPSAAALLVHPWLARHAQDHANIYQWSLSPSDYPVVP